MITIVWLQWSILGGSWIMNLFRLTCFLLTLILTAGGVHWGRKRIRIAVLQWRDLDHTYSGERVYRDVHLCGLHLFGWIIVRGLTLT